MANQLEVAKANQYVAIGPPADSISVSKLTMYVLLIPGDGIETPPPRQAHVYSQKVRRS